MPIPISQARRAFPLAAVAEMTDRVHAGWWDENLDRPVLDYPALVLRS